MMFNILYLYLYNYLLSRQFISITRLAKTALSLIDAILYQDKLSQIMWALFDIIYSYIYKFLYLGPYRNIILHVSILIIYNIFVYKTLKRK